ncbi:MAG: hypothetical protein HYR94_25785 [Chloroflexi bacterium]|nr:hypothetical protein [Chloroflexota bacterium]
MMRGNDLRLIELAFDYISAETEQQANQVYDQAATLATEITIFTVWLDLIDYMEKWNRSNEHKSPMSRASALQFFSTRQAEFKPTQTENL